MSTILQLFTIDSVAHIIFILSLVSALGLFIGSIRICGINLGITGVLFSGLLFGYLKLSIDIQILEFLRDFGLVLFVYTVGIQVGPGFLSSFKKDGLPLNIMAATIVIAGALIAVGIGYFTGFPKWIVVGMFSGATTNTPSLAAAQETLHNIKNITPEMIELSTLSYAVSYPFGIIGIILAIIILRFMFKINPSVEIEKYLTSQKAQQQNISVINVLVNNPNLHQTCIKNIPFLDKAKVVISRIYHDGKLHVAKGDTIIYLGDVLLVVGPKIGLDDVCTLIGMPADIDLRKLPSNIISKQLIVTKKEALGKSLADLEISSRFDVMITRITRAELELPATAEMKLHFADTILVVGKEEDIYQVSLLLGDSPTQLNHPQIIPVFIGIALGVMLGNWNFHLPGISTPIKLGIAGGPLLVSILLSSVRRIGPIVWYMPISANFILRELGIILFLACVGLKSGAKFFDILLRGDGLQWMLWSTVITFIPLICVGFFARFKYKLNFMSLCGLLSGSMTDPPALAFANSIASSNAPSISYATVYPLVMLLRILLAQFIVLFL